MNFLLCILLVGGCCVQAAWPVMRKVRVAGDLGDEQPGLTGCPDLPSTAWLYKVSIIMYNITNHNTLRSANILITKHSQQFEYK